MARHERRISGAADRDKVTVLQRAYLLRGWRVGDPMPAGGNGFERLDWDSEDEMHRRGLLTIEEAADVLGVELPE